MSWEQLPSGRMYKNKRYNTYTIQYVQGTKFTSSTHLFPHYPILTIINIATQSTKAQLKYPYHGCHIPFP